MAENCEIYISLETTIKYLFERLARFQILYKTNLELINRFKTQLHIIKNGHSNEGIKFAYSCCHCNHLYVNYKELEAHYPEQCTNARLDALSLYHPPATPR